MLAPVKEKPFYKALFSIAVPLAAQNMITFAVSLADTVMLGQLSETALSAANLANELYFVLMIIGFGITSGSTVFAAQYWGKRDTASIRKIITIMLRITLAFSILATCVAAFLPETFMRLYSDDEAVIAQGAEYLRVMAFGYLFYSVANALFSILRTVRTVKISVIAYLISLCVNISLNWVLIFGHLGFPAMGVRGAAIATVIARFTEFAIAVAYIRFKEDKIRYRFREFFGSVKGYSEAFWKIGAPVVLNESLWSVGATVLSMVIGHISTQFVAANSIATVVWQFFWVAMSGMANATAVMIGNAIGEGDSRELVQRKADTVTYLALGLGLVSCLLMLLVRPFAVQLFAVSEETRKLAMDLLVTRAILMISQGATCQSIVGILRGGGDTRFAMLVDVFFLWTVSIPLGLCAGFLFKWSPPLVLLALRSDEIIKFLVATVRIQRGKWIRDVTVTVPGVSECGCV